MVTLEWGNLVPSSALFRDHIHSYAQTHTQIHKHTKTKKKKKREGEPCVVIYLYPTFRKQRRKSHCKFQVSLVYVDSSKLIRAAEVLGCP